MSSGAQRTRWPGGYVHIQKDRRVLYIIERLLYGRRYHVSTRAHTLRGAMVQLEIFESNPAEYLQNRDRSEKPLLLDAELIEKFHAWQLEEKKNTRKHANELQKMLDAWSVDLDSIDLRKVTIRDHIQPAIERRKTCRPRRIAALKVFYAWMRKERGLLKHHEDPTLDLSVPQATPEKWRRRKAVEFSRVLAAAAHLEEAYLDCLRLVAATGIHTTELERFIRDQNSQLLPVNNSTTIAVLITRHKSGEMTRIPIMDPEVRDAGLRLRHRGRVPKQLNAALLRACVAAKVEPFSFGVLRHSVATWAIEGGASPDAVAQFLGHKDKRTTQRFYADVSVPVTPVTLPRLVLVRNEG